LMKHRTGRSRPFQELKLAQSPDEPIQVILA
jgi:hypothetical protein